MIFHFPLDVSIESPYTLKQINIKKSILWIGTTAPTNSLSLTKSSRTQSRGNKPFHASTISSKIFWIRYWNLPSQFTTYIFPVVVHQKTDECKDSYSQLLVSLDICILKSISHRLAVVVTIIEEAYTREIRRSKFRSIAANNYFMRKWSYAAS